MLYLITIEGHKNKISKVVFSVFETLIILH